MTFQRNPPPPLAPPLYPPLLPPAVPPLAPNISLAPPGDIVATPSACTLPFLQHAGGVPNAGDVVLLLLSSYTEDHCQNECEANTELPCVAYAITREESSTYCNLYAYPPTVDPSIGEDVALLTCVNQEYYLECDTRYEQSDGRSPRGAPSIAAWPTTNTSACATHCDETPGCLVYTIAMSNHTGVTCSFYNVLDLQNVISAQSTEVTCIRNGLLNRPPRTPPAPPQPPAPHTPPVLPPFTPPSPPPDLAAALL